MRSLVEPGNKKLFEDTLTRGIELKGEKALKEVYDGLSGLMIQVLGFNPRIALPVLRETKEEIMDEPGTMEVQTQRIPTSAITPRRLEAQEQAALQEFVETQRRLEAERQAQQPPPQPTPPPVPPPQAAAPVNPMMLQRAAQVLGPQDEIGMLAAEMLMRQRPS